MRLSLEDREDHLLLAHVDRAFDLEVARDLRQVGDSGPLERFEIQHSLGRNHLDRFRWWL